MVIYHTKLGSDGDYFRKQYFTNIAESAVDQKVLCWEPCLPGVSFVG